MIFDIVEENDQAVLLKEVVFGQACDLVELLWECGFAYKCRLACYGEYENAVELSKS